MAYMYTEHNHHTVVSNRVVSADCSYAVRIYVYQKDDKIIGTQFGTARWLSEDEFSKLVPHYTFQHVESRGPVRVQDLFFFNKLLLIVQHPLTSVIDFTRVMVRKWAGEIWGRLLV